MAESRCVACGSQLTKSIPYPHPRSLLFTDLKVGLCTGCGLGSVVEAIPPDRLHSYYAEDYADLAGRGSRAEPTAYFADCKAMFRPRRSLSQLRLAEAHLARPPRRILDLGAGFGTTLYLAKTDFWEDAELIAVEPDRSMAPYLRHASAEVVGDLSEVAPHSVDLVIASHVLEHYQAGEIRGILGRLLQILAPEGKVVAEVPNSDFCAYPRAREHSHEPHLMFFSQKAFEAMFRDAGFSVAFSSTVGSLQSRGPLADLAEKVRRRLAGGSEYGRHRAAIRLLATAPAS